MKQISLFPEKPTAYEIYSKYLRHIQRNREAANNFKNGINRYFIPAIDGPRPSSNKHTRLSKTEQEAALNYLKNQVSLEQLASCHDLATETLFELKVSNAQRERTRRALHLFVDWATEAGYLPSPTNPIPYEVCAKLPLEDMSQFDLKLATPLECYLEYQTHLGNKREAKNSLQNAIVKYFVPATGGPLTTHLGITPAEMEAAHKHLSSIPMSYLHKAIEFSTVALKAFGVAKTHKTRMRNALRDFLAWCRKHNYLPLIAQETPAPPWSNDIASKNHENDLVFEWKYEYTSRQIFDAYCAHLKETGNPDEVTRIRSIIVRYFIPAIGGPEPKGNRTEEAEIQAGLVHLEEVSPEQLTDACSVVEKILKQKKAKPPTIRANNTIVGKWIEWAQSQKYLEPLVSPIEELPFNLIRKVGEHRTKKRHRPGAQMHERRVPVHLLCAKQFTDDYVNELLADQLRHFWDWWESKGAMKGTISSAKEQLMQLLGWLHRYEQISLEELKFESLITKSQLIIEAEFDIDNIDEEAELAQYYEQISKLTSRQALLKLQARMHANKDMKRVNRYLEFLKENHPGSKQKRIALIVAITKFLYREEIGTEDFPTPNSIPILWRLLNKQAELGTQNKNTPRTVPLNHKNMLPWNYAVKLVMLQKKRCEQYILYRESSQYKKGYTTQPRKETGIARELQNFLSIALPVIAFPSRSRTYYDLRIGETFREGCFVEGQFRSKEELQKEGLLKKYEDRICFYIHHMLDDSKIGKTIAGEWEFGWWALIPDYEFPDGTRLYQYIWRWLDWGRPVLGATWHNYFFVRRNTNEPANHDTWRARTKNMFNREFGVCVPPRHLRIVYSTCLSAQNASQEVKDAAACALEHSRQMHDEKYDMLASVRRIEPAIAFNLQYVDRILKGTDLPN